MRISLGYLEPGDESELLLARARRRRERVELDAVCDRDTLRELQAMVEEVHLSESVAACAVSLVCATRNSPQLSLGASPRGSLALMKLARARAALHGRDFVKGRSSHPKRPASSDPPNRPRGSKELEILVLRHG